MDWRPEPSITKIIQKVYFPLWLTPDFWQRIKYTGKQQWILLNPVTKNRHKQNLKIEVKHEWSYCQVPRTRCYKSESFSEDIMIFNKVTAHSITIILDNKDNNTSKMEHVGGYYYSCCTWVCRWITNKLLEITNYIACRIHTRLNNHVSIKKKHSYCMHISRRQSFMKRHYKWCTTSTYKSSGKDQTWQNQPLVLWSLLGSLASSWSAIPVGPGDICFWHECNSEEKKNPLNPGKWCVWVDGWVGVVWLFWPNCPLNAYMHLSCIFDRKKR